MRLAEVSEELEKERRKVLHACSYQPPSNLVYPDCMLLWLQNESGSVEWVQRCRKLTDELEWLRKSVDKVTEYVS